MTICEGHTLSHISTFSGFYVIPYILMYFSLERISIFFSCIFSSFFCLVGVVSVVCMAWHFISIHMTIMFRIAWALHRSYHSLYSHFSLVTEFMFVFYTRFNLYFDKLLKAVISVRPMYIFRSTIKPSGTSTMRYVPKIFFESDWLQPTEREKKNDSSNMNQSVHK